MRHWIIAAVIAIVPLSAIAASTVITLDGLPVGPSGYVNDHSVTSNGVQLVNHYDSTYFSWSGFALSNVNAPNTAGWANQYAAVTGVGVGGSGNYAVGYMDTFTTNKVLINLPVGTLVEGLNLTNNAYAYWSMHDGDGFAKKFGGATGNDPDYLKLTITGYSDGSSTGAVDFYLADYRSAIKTLVDKWEWIDLRPLGSNVDQLQFTLASSDIGAFGINTPTYFAMDNLTVASVPEPTSMAVLGLTGLILCRRRARVFGKRPKANTILPRKP